MTVNGAFRSQNSTESTFPSTRAPGLGLGYGYELPAFHDETTLQRRQALAELCAVENAGGDYVWVTSPLFRHRGEELEATGSPLQACALCSLPWKKQ